MATTAVLQQPSAAAAAGAASPHPTAGTSSSHGTGRRMSRPPAAAVAPTDGWEDDVVPTLRRRLEAESAYLSHRLSTHLTPPLSSTPPSGASAPSSSSLAFPSASTAGPAASPKTPSKIPVSPLSRARSKSRGAVPAAGASSRALQDAVGQAAADGAGVGPFPAEVKGSSYVPHVGESGSSGDDASAAGQRGAGDGASVPVRAGVVARPRTKSTPFAPPSSSSSAQRGVSPRPSGVPVARTPSPAMQTVRLPAAAAGVLPVGSSAPRGGMKPLYLAPGTSSGTGAAVSGAHRALPPPTNGALAPSSASTSSGSLTPRAGGSAPPLVPPLQSTWPAGATTATATTTAPPLTPSPSPSPPPPPPADNAGGPSSHDAHRPSITDVHPAGRQARLPSDRLIRDEVAPFQILSRDLRAVRPDGRVELGSGDGFTERELVRQMPSVWRTSAVPSSNGEASPRRGSLAGWEDEAERAREDARAADERKRLERRQELLDIARNGWELDDDAVAPDDVGGPPATSQQHLPASRGLTGSATAGNLAAAASSGDRRRSSGQPSPMPQTSSPAGQDEQEARRRRREEGAQRQRALSTGAGRRSVSGPNGVAHPARSPSPPPPALPSTHAGRRVSAGAKPPPSSSSGPLANGRPSGESAGSLHAAHNRRASLQPSSSATGLAKANSSSAAGGGPSAFDRALANGPAQAATAADDGAGTADDRSSIRLSLYGEDAVPPMAADKPTRDELMNWDSVVIPAVRKKKKHNPLLEWDDSISNPSSTPPAKGTRRDPYTPPAAATGPAVAPLSFGDGGDGEGEGDWPPPAPGTFAYKPPRSRTTTGGEGAGSTTPPDGEGERSQQQQQQQQGSPAHPLEDRTDPANAGGPGHRGWDPLARAGGTGAASDENAGAYSPAPSSSQFDGSNGHRRMSKVRDSASYHPQVANPVLEAQEHDDKLAATAERKSSRRARRRGERIDEEADDGVVRKSGCCGAGCVVM